MILHLLSDPDFVSLIMNQMEECCPGENLFLILSGKQSLSTAEINYGNKVIYLKDLPSIDFTKIDGILIHYLSIQAAKLIGSIPNNIPIACSIWGGDFYNYLPKFRQNLYGNLTKEYLNHFQKWPGFYYYLKSKLIFPISYNYHFWKKVVKKSKIYSTVIPYEKNYVGKYFNTSTKYIQMPTFSLEKVINTDDYENKILTKEKFRKNILIGNSGHPTNNHLEILHLIKSLKTEDISVHLPLTYGNSEYIEHICKIGKSLLGKRFCPLLNHLNIKDFYNFINCFNIFIFNNYRQQGIGTIVLAIWAGGKVFLSNKNVTKSFYEDYGLKVFSIENNLIVTNSSDLFTPLTREEILVNRERLVKLYSNVTVNDSIRNLFTILKGTATKN